MIEHIIPIITIWIHGTRPTEMAPAVLEPIINKIEKVLFVDKSKKHLLSTKDLIDHEYLYEIAQSYSNAAQSNIEDFYFFPWSGKLDPKARKKAADQLTKEIEQLLTIYESRYKEKPLLNIIAHSHGGNVTLLLAHQLNPSFFVNKLILLGCPVQLKTKRLVHSPLFKQVYNIHSHTDWIQVLDPQGIHLLFDQERESDFFGLLNNFFSARHFDTTDPKITQINVQWNKYADQLDQNLPVFPVWLSKRLLYASKLPFKRGLFHIEFTMLPFIKRLPNIISHFNNEDIVKNKLDTELILN